MASASRDYAFVTGCARSGTTALAWLLNRHPDVVMGMERFFKLGNGGKLRPELFEPERFRTVSAQDTHPYGQSFYTEQRVGFDKIDTARVVGDKQPRLIFNLEQLKAFGRPKIVFILREPFTVAQSFDARAQNEQDEWRPGRDHTAAVQQFNKSLASLDAALEEGWFPIHIVRFEQLFGAREGLTALLEFLGVDPARMGPTADLFEKSDQLAAEGRLNTVGQHVALNANFRLYRKAVRIAMRSVEAHEQALG